MAQSKKAAARAYLAIAWVSLLVIVLVRKKSVLGDANPNVSGLRFKLLDLSIRCEAEMPELCAAILENELYPFPGRYCAPGTRVVSGLANVCGSPHGNVAQSHHGGVGSSEL